MPVMKIKGKEFGEMLKIFKLRKQHFEVHPPFTYIFLSFLNCCKKV